MKRRTNATYAMAALIGAAVLAACGTQSGGSEADSDVDSDAPVTGVRWVPRSLTVDGEKYAMPSKADAYLEFDPGKADGAAGGKSGGSTGCNHFGADVDIEGDTIKVSDFAATQKGCPDGLWSFEERFIDVFTGNLTAKLSDEGRTLTLTGGDGDSITLGSQPPKPLEGTEWTVTALAGD